MLKRKREGEDERRFYEPSSKRPREIGPNHFLELSDEIVLRTLSFLSVNDLLTSERVCQRFRRLASDNEIWKEKFYLQFVRPRARRIPAVNALNRKERHNQALYYASKSARWLEHNTTCKRLSTSSGTSDWKRKYKIKLNWTKGQCRAHEVALDCPYQPRILVKLCQGTIYTADEKKLRSYSQRVRPQILKTHYWKTGKRPTTMAVDMHGNKTSAIVGFSDGSLEILEVQYDGSFTPTLYHAPSNCGAINSLAITWPYLLTMSSDHRMTLLKIMEQPDKPHTLTTLASLHSNALLLPVSLSIRKTSSALTASVAYSFSRLNAGWCLGLQEIKLALTGNVLESRLTSTVETPMQDFPFRRGTITSRSTSTAPFALHPNLMNPPTSLSHSGCYVLASLPDNTLMVYTVTSNHDKLEISAGRRLFGHTSSVSGAEVSDRGKALSISAKGDEIRIWELEDLLSSWSLQKSSTQLKPRYSCDDLNIALARRGTGLGLAVKELKDEFAWSRHWVGFDEEQVVVLGERDQRQILSCYDFA